MTEGVGVFGLCGSDGFVTDFTKFRDVAAFVAVAAVAFLEGGEALAVQFQAL